MEPLNQTVIKEVHFRFDWRRSLHTYSEVHISIACLFKYGEKKHTGGQKEVQRIDDGRWCSMKCPQCGKKTVVTNSRTGSDVVIRARKCKCGCEFRTTEYMDTSDETAEELRMMMRQARDKCLAKKAKEAVK